MAVSGMDTDCELYREPKTNKDFWKTKIDRNRENDQKNLYLLRSAGWRVMNIWECALRNRGNLHLENTADEIAKWLRSDELLGEIRD